MKAPSPLLGFNNNFKHKGQVYHIQTEDSGVKHPHIITHLFADGGRVLKSIKTSYATMIGDPKMADIVRDMMKEQHKAMIIALRDGQFDPGGAREVALPTTGPFADATSAGQTRGGAAGVTQKQTPAAKHAEQPPSPVTAPPVTRPASAPAPPPIDVAALERAAANASHNSPVFQIESDLPPPPANVLGGGAARPHGPYSDVGQATGKRLSHRPETTADAHGPATGQDIPEAGSPSGPHRPPTSRYVLTRPASIFATGKPNQGSIFGEELISERSLDEVILSYLAEDLEGEKK